MCFFMKEEIQILISQIESDLGAIATLFSHISPYENKQPQTSFELIAVGYYLHNLYCAFENIFRNITKTFEKQISDSSQLLRLMKLEIQGIRPSIISKKSYDCLDELRRFRHLFRAAYDIELDWERMALVVKKALQLKQIYTGEINNFLQFLNEILEEFE